MHIADLSARIDVRQSQRATVGGEPSQLLKLACTMYNSLLSHVMHCHGFVENISK